MLPNYFVIGGPKCGTTTLCSLLGQHPEVFMSEPKEIHYFGRKDPKKTRTWYEGHFSAAVRYNAVGEGSTSYTHPDIIAACADEIAEAVPEARLIYMVRNPIRRLESDWKMRKHEGWAPGGSINEAVQEEGTTLIRHGLYWDNLSVYRRRFPDEQLQIVFLEDFASAPEPQLRQCFEFLGVDPDVDVGDSRRVENRSSDFRRDRLLARWLREAGVISSLRSLVPGAVFTRAKALMTQPDHYAVEWDPALRNAIGDRLRTDSRHLLEYCGKPTDFWNFP